MLSTKKLVSNYKEVPQSFIFEHYCNLKEKLVGQDIKIKSLFNDKDTAPSMCIYVDEKKNYKYKDFSSGKGGEAINLVMDLKNISFKEATALVMRDYINYKFNNETYEISFKQHSKYKVSAFNVRKWNTDDKDFWTEFYIGSEFLDKYNIKPLSDYTMTKKDEESLSSINMKGRYIYGFFNKKGELYKIYQPKNKEKKYLKVKSYLQGSDQLEGFDTLIILSGIKDIGAMKSLKLNVDCIAPDSENTTLSKDVIKQYKKKYKNLFVLFDNDKPGIEAMKKYKKEYSIPGILITTGKDLAEAVSIKGPRDIRQKVIAAIELKTFSS